MGAARSFDGYRLDGGLYRYRIGWLGFDACSQRDLPTAYAHTTRKLKTDDYSQWLASVSRLELLYIAKTHEAAPRRSSSDCTGPHMHYLLLCTKTKKVVPMFLYSNLVVVACRVIVYHTYRAGKKVWTDVLRMYMRETVC